MSATKQRSTGSNHSKPEPSDQRSGTAILVGAMVAMLVVAVVVVVLVTRGGRDSATVGVLHQTQAVSVTGTPLPALPNGGVDPAVGATAPTASGKGFDGTDGVVPAPATPTMIIFAAHWCPHCQREIPLIVDWLASGAARGADVVLVATGTNADAPNYPPSAWLADVGWPGRVIADDDQGTLAHAYGLESFPLIIFVQADGTVARRIAGEQERAALDAGIAAIAAPATPAG